MLLGNKVRGLWDWSTHCINHNCNCTCVSSVGHVQLQSDPTWGRREARQSESNHSSCSICSSVSSLIMNTYISSHSHGKHGENIYTKFSASFTFKLFKHGFGRSMESFSWRPVPRPDSTSTRPLWLWQSEFVPAFLQNLNTKRKCITFIKQMWNVAGCV